MNKEINKLTSEESAKIGTTIMHQIGHGALFMIGAKNYVCDNYTLIFQIRGNSKGVNYIKITLNAMDTYDIQYLNRRFHSKILEYKETIKSEDNGIYNDMLSGSIESNTGLYTSL